MEIYAEFIRNHEKSAKVREREGGERRRRGEGREGGKGRGTEEERGGEGREGSKDHIMVLFLHCLQN